MPGQRVWEAGSGEERNVSGRWTLGERTGAGVGWGKREGAGFKSLQWRNQRMRQARRSLSRDPSIPRHTARAVFQKARLILTARMNWQEEKKEDKRE